MGKHKPSDPRGLQPPPDTPGSWLPSQAGVSRRAPSFLASVVTLLFYQQTWDEANQKEASGGSESPARACEALWASCRCPGGLGFAPGTHPAQYCP